MSVIVSSDPNSANWILKWGTVAITIDGETIDPKDCCFAQSGVNGKIHLYQRTKAGQIITLQGQPRVIEKLGAVTVAIGNTTGCKACTRNSFKRRPWWKIAHLEK